MPSKTVVVTGASSGIGRAVSIEFAKRGYNVIACARRLELMEDLKQFGINPFKVDVTSAADVEALRKYIELDYAGEVLYLFNNAGQPCRAPAGEVDDETAKNCYEVNFFGVIRVTRELLSFVIKTKGTIGFTGSVSALMPFPFASMYASSKAAVHAYAETLAVELQPFGVKVCNFITGGVATEIYSPKQFKDGSLYRVPGYEDFMERIKSIVSESPVTPEAYALKVVSDFEKLRIGRVAYYRGHMAMAARFMTNLVPRKWLVNALIKNFKLTRMFDYISSNLGKKQV